jgi:hypothetical protein
MKYALAALICVNTLLAPATAEVRQSEETTKLVKDVTTAFFAMLPSDNFEAERAFMTDEFAAATPIDSWTRARRLLIANVGATPRYVPHRLTYYDEMSLLAAVDFSGQGTSADTFVCGYILWELPAPDLIGFIRLEQNVVQASSFKSMPVQQAAQLMTQWHCPAALIEQVLAIEIQ